MKTPKYEEIVGSILAIGALAVVSYVVVVTGNDTALGAEVALLSAATGFFLRGRVQTDKP